MKNEDGIWRIFDRGQIVGGGMAIKDIPKELEDKTVLGEYFNNAMQKNEDGIWKTFDRGHIVGGGMAIKDMPKNLKQIKLYQMSISIMR